MLGSKNLAFFQLETILKAIPTAALLLAGMEDEIMGMQLDWYL